MGKWAPPFIKSGKRKDIFENGEILITRQNMETIKDSNETVTYIYEDEDIILPDGIGNN